MNERQIEAVNYVKKEGNIKNKIYRDIFDVSKRTTTSDLTELVELGILNISEHNAVISRLNPGEIKREDIPKYERFSIRELFFVPFHLQPIRLLCKKKSSSTTPSMTVFHMLSRSEYLCISNISQENIK